jgi:hypothetical protein
VDDDFALSPVVEFDQEDALPLPEHEPSIKDRHGLAGAQD